MKPFIKWAGGKRSLAEQISSILGPIPDGATYFEPFLGGGAMLLYIQPHKAECFDINRELINLYNVVKEQPTLLLETLREDHFAKHCPSHYYDVRNLDRNLDEFAQMTPVQRAARFLYLNKTCYNGLWRENGNGQNNVPLGRYKNPCVIADDEVMAVSRYFHDSDIKFHNIDYKSILEYAKAGDVVYFDPPYDIEESQNGFVAYARGGFFRDEQLQLKETCDNLVKRGVLVAVSNSNTEYIRTIYSEGPVRYEFHDDICARRSIGSRTGSRKSIKELLIIGRP